MLTTGCSSLYLDEVGLAARSPVLRGPDRIPIITTVARMASNAMYARSLAVYAGFVIVFGFACMGRAFPRLRPEPCEPCAVARPTRCLERLRRSCVTTSRTALPTTALASSPGATSTPRASRAASPFDAGVSPLAGVLCDGGRPPSSTSTASGKCFRWRALGHLPLPLPTWEDIALPGRGRCGWSTVAGHLLPGFGLGRSRRLARALGLPPRGRGAASDGSPAASA